MVDKLTQPTWDPLVLAAQLQKIAKQSQTLMQRFVSNQPAAIKLGIGDTSSLGFDFFELMTRMMTDPVAVARAQIDLFYNSLGIWQKTAERMLMLRAREADAPKDKRFRHPDWSENAIFDFVKDSYLVAAKAIFLQSAKSKAWTRPRLAGSISTRASSLMPCRLPISSPPIRRSSPQPYSRVGRTCYVVWRTFLPIWNAAMVGLRLR